ncbi:hypothetical protein CgunFtcFv8_002908 [Champsocephalus gunnari]|uniref:Uncharacterized protein n=1 Tax=Champsocephalus gunnari TaxID=52237 RepID=A0AAN8DAR2_CHAGU|nr:hypothetical protein CgunFtcFv8_002908 [Champsocephalus gunnari]
MNSCQNILGQKKRRHPDWYDENDTEIQQIIDIKRHTFITWQNNIHCKVKRAAHAKAEAAVQMQVRKLKTSGGQRRLWRSSSLPTLVIQEDSLMPQERYMVPAIAA